jgi:uncharacterized protein
VVAFVCTMAVNSLDGCIAKAEGTGTRVCVPRMLIPGVGWLAYADDAEGSVLGMMEKAPKAK